MPVSLERDAQQNGNKQYCFCVRQNVHCGIMSAAHDGSVSSSINVIMWSIAVCSGQPLYVPRPAAVVCHIRRPAAEHSARPSLAQNSSSLTTANK